LPAASYYPIPVSATVAPTAPALTPTIAPTLTVDAPEQAPTKSWVERTGSSESTARRIDQILNDGSLTDKNRASAILAAREEETAADMTANRR
jgi:hypothetical protein